MINMEIRNRIRLSVAAYAYEIRNDPVMTDAEFDKLALQILPEQETGNERLDEFFRTEFVSFSGIWIHSHPEQNGLERIYQMLKEPLNTDFRYNRDLFAPFIETVKRVTENVENPCRRCGKDFMKAPAKGGCHC